MITKKRLIDLIQSHSEGSTDRLSDGVLFDSLADAILLELQQNNGKPFVSGSLPSDKLIREKGKEIYSHGSYWSGVKADAFREGAKWIKSLWKYNVGRQ